MSSQPVALIVASLTALSLAGCNPFASPEPVRSDLTARTQARAPSAAIEPSCACSASAEAQKAVPPARKPANATKPAPAPAVLDADLGVKRLVLARGVEGREPVEPSETFALDEAKQIYAFVEVQNPDQVESEIFVTFEKDGGPSVGHVTLRVGPSSRWRTWAFTRGATTAGKWTAVVRDGDGDLLARQPFEITS